MFPSTFETQGLVLIEAMAAGTPVVAVEATGTQDALSDGRGGVLVPYDAEAFTDAILALLVDDQRRNRLGAEAVETASRYGIQEVTTRLERVYSGVLESRRGE